MGLEATWCPSPSSITCPKCAALHSPEGTSHSWVVLKGRHRYKLHCGRSFLDRATLWPWPGLLLASPASSGSSHTHHIGLLSVPQTCHVCSALEALCSSTLPHSFNKHLKQVVARGWVGGADKWNTWERLRGTNSFQLQNKQVTGMKCTVRGIWSIIMSYLCMMTVTWLTVVNVL